jgi:AraC-like DNA-binding protein
MYREAPPPPALAGAVRCVWWSTGDRPTHVVPDGCVDVVVHTAGRVFVAGPDTRSWHAAPSPGSLMYGVRFRPGHAPRALGVAADELLDRRVDLADLWGRQAAERLLDRPSAVDDAVAGRLLATTPSPVSIRSSLSTVDPVVDEALRRLDAGTSRLGDLLTGLGVGERQLRRRFTHAVGYGPATYLRVRRLRRAMDRARTTADLATLAAEAGYADQAHLSRDCRELTGTTPSRFFTLAR